MALLNDPMTKFSKYGVLWYFLTQNPSIRKILQKNFFFPIQPNPGPDLEIFRKNSEIKVLGHFIEFGISGWSYFAYSDRYN